MKKVFILAGFLICLARISYGQQKQVTPPKVDLTKFTPPVKKNPTVNNPQRNVSKKDIPKVDLSNFKPPVSYRETKVKEQQKK